MKFVQVVLMLVVTLLFEDCSAAELTAPTAEETVSGAFNHTSNYLRKNVSMKIVQGSRAKLGQFPYQAGLLIEATEHAASYYECGASLISTTRLLTAAHCWLSKKYQAEYFIVVLGSIKLYEGGTRFVTRDVTVHESYNKYTLDNDIAIISIPSVTITKYIQPIALPPPGDERKSFAGYSAVASGFGNTGTGIYQSYLMYVNLIVTLGAACLDYREIRTTEICTEGVDTRNTCVGDSGGPLAINGTNGELVLIGVTSYGGPDGCSADASSGFTRITSFLPWIREHMTS